jgi:hypothetical protein
MSFIAGPIATSVGAKPKGLAKKNAQQQFQFAAAAYQNEEHRPDELAGYTLDKELSTKRQAVYHNPDTNEAIVAFRGTHFSDPKDVYEDLKIVTGTFGTSQRVENGKKLVKDVSDKYNIDTKDIELTGHSLGGRVAQAVGQHYGSSVTAVNPGSSPIDLFVPTAGSGYGRTYTTGVDPVSLSNTFRNPSAVKYRLPKTPEVHGLANFLRP